MRVAICAFAAAWCTFAARADAAQLYRWVDASGKVHYTDKLPPPDATGVERKRVNTDAGTPAVPYALQRAMAAYPVTLYTADCGEPCDGARQFLDRWGVPFAEKNARDPEANAALKQLVGAAEVPVLVVGKAVLKGFETNQWTGALDAAGYPRLPAGARPDVAKRQAGGPASEGANAQSARAEPGERPK
jgi:glutaredoxin